MRRNCHLRIYCRYHNVKTCNDYNLNETLYLLLKKKTHFFCMNSFFLILIFFKTIFTVKREHALTSGTIKAMLSGPGQFAENEANEVNFREIPSHVLQKVCMYFTYKVRYTNSSTEIPEFPIAPEIALELLMAANFLDC